MSLQDKVKNDIIKRDNIEEITVNFTKEELSFLLDKIGECDCKIANIQFVYDLIVKLYTKYQETLKKQDEK